MRELNKVNVHLRSPESWIPLPVLLRSLEEAQRVVLPAGEDGYIVGHAAHFGHRWWVVPDWFATAANLPAFTES